MGGSVRSDGNGRRVAPADCVIAGAFAFVTGVADTPGARTTWPLVASAIRANGCTTGCGAFITGRSEIVIGSRTDVDIVFIGADAACVSI